MASPSTLLAAARRQPDLMPRFMLRVAGLPFDVLDRLGTSEAAAWADAVLDGEQALRADAARLADALAEVVAHNLTDDGVRRILINLRRDVFNLRAPRGVDRASEALPEQVRADLRAWLTQRERHLAVVADGPTALAGELRTGRAALREIAGEPDLRYGIQLASPDLDTYLGGYLRADPAKLSKRGRRIERSLLEYLYRTAAKTSPFSTLTAVCLGRFDDGPRFIDATVDSWAKRGASRLNLAVLARLSAELIASPLVRRDLPVHATTGLAVHADRVRYLRRQQTAGGREQDAVTLDTVHENLFFLPSGTGLTDLLGVLEHGKTVRLGELVGLLCAQDPARQESDVETFLGHLVRLGLLVVPDLRLDIHDPDPVASYARGLRGFDREWADRLAEQVSAAGAAAATFTTEELDRRGAVLTEIREHLNQAKQVVGADVQLPRTLVYEDTALDAAVVADKTRWREQLLPDLNAVAEMLPAFDTNAVRRLFTKGYFTTRYRSGRCTDFLSFAHDFQQDVYTNFSQRMMRHQRFDDTTIRPYDNWFRQPEITALDDARAAIAKDVARRHAENGDGELVLDADFTGMVAAAGMRTSAPVSSMTAFLQIADRGQDDPPLGVVNRIYSGLTLLFSRFAHLFGTELPEDLRSGLSAACPDGAVFAELTGGYDATNLNLHPVLTPYEIVCPGETSFRPADEQIPTEDLVIEHDPVADRVLLRSTRLGVEVIPVYLGFLMPMALPEIQQVLLNFSVTTLAQLDLWAGTGVVGDGVTALPRIRLGNLVLGRREWRAGAEHLPRPGAEVGDDARMLAWRRWQRAHGLPRRVFATLGGQHKPLYVDFDSSLSVNLLDTMARGTTGATTFAEMLPGPDHLWMREGAQRYVTELTVQIDERRSTP